MTLKDGVTYDSKLRTGYIASNYQFQFDSPPQDNALVTSGFALCADNVLALGTSQTFYRCLSGTFYNLYNTNWAPQCEEVSIIALPCGSEGAVSQGSDGQIVGTTIVQTTIITALPDGQPQVVTTSVPVTLYTTIATTSAAPVSQISDGQVQAPPPTTAVPASGTTVVVPTETAPTSGALTTATGTAAATGSSGSTTKAASTITSSAKISSSTAAATTSAPASTTSAPSQGGSARVATGSVGALVVGLVVAFVFA
jgi:hypothetical protein